MTDIIIQGINISAMQRNSIKQQEAIRTLVEQNKRNKVEWSRLEEALKNLAKIVDTKADDHAANLGQFMKNLKGNPRR